MSVLSSTPNYKIHPLNVLEKMENAHGSNKNFALLRIVFGEQMPEEIARKYKYHISIHNESQLNTRFPTTGFTPIMPNEILFDKAFTKKTVDFHIKMEMWYRSNDSYDFCAFDVLPSIDLSSAPLIMQPIVIESNCRKSLSVPFLYFPTNPDIKWTLNKWTGPVKIYHPTRCPLYILVEEDESALTLIT